MFGLGFQGIRGQETNANETRKDKRHGQTKWTRRQKRQRSTIFHLIVFISCVFANILYPPLKGKNNAKDEQDKNNTDSSVAETVDTDPAPRAEVLVAKEAEAAAPAEVTVEKEVKVAPPPDEVIDQTKRTKGNG